MARGARLAKSGGRHVALAPRPPAGDHRADFGRRSTMRRLVPLVAALALLAAPALADPILGLWKTQEDDGAFAHVQMAPCGAAFCGRIVKTFNATGEYASPNLGKTLVIDMRPDGAGSYAGQVWRPSNNKVYTGKIALNGNAMRLSGCVAGGLICSRQTWTRLQ
jgi:uncharacterized protein (DUF2147 family)